MTLDRMPPPPFESYKTEIIFQSDYFHIEKITHRRGAEKNCRYEVVAFPDARITIRNVEVK